MILDLVLLAWLCGGGVAQAGLLLLLGRWPNAMRAAHVAGALLSVAAALAAVQRAGLDRAVYVTPGRGLPLGLWLEPLGAFAALLIALAAAFCAVFAAGHARAAPVTQPARLAAAMALSASAACCLALAGTLATLALALPLTAAAAALLIAHASAGRAAAAAYALFCDFALRALLLLVPVAIWAATQLNLTVLQPGGILAQADRLEQGVVLAALLVGLGGLTLRPLRSWPGAAVLAPAPGAVLLLTGGLTVPLAAAVLKVLRFGFAADLAELEAARWALLALLGASLAASGVAMLRRETWRERLALLTWSQLALLLFGALLGSPGALLGGVLQMGAAWATCLGLGLAIAVVDVATGRDRPALVRGLGRRMPLTFLAFTAAALSASGAPPLAGGWARVWLAAGASQAGAQWALLPMLAAGVLTFFAFGLPAVRASIDPAPEQPFSRPDGASLLLLGPTVAAGLCAALFMLWVEPILGRIGLLGGGAG